MLAWSASSLKPESCAHTRPALWSSTWEEERSGRAKEPSPRKVSTARWERLLWLELISSILAQAVTTAFKLITRTCQRLWDLAMISASRMETWEQLSLRQSSIASRFNSKSQVLLSKADQSSSQVTDWHSYRSCRVLTKMISFVLLSRTALTTFLFQMSHQLRTCRRLSMHSLMRDKRLEFSPRLTTLKQCISSREFWNMQVELSSWEMSFVTNFPQRSSWLLKSGWFRQRTWQQCPSTFNHKSWNRWSHRIWRRRETMPKTYRLPFSMAQMDSSSRMRQVLANTQSKRPSSLPKQLVKLSKFLIMSRPSRTPVTWPKNKAATLTLPMYWHLQQLKSPSTTTST